MKTYEPTDISPYQTQFAIDLRVPFITSLWPRWNYITAIAVCPEGHYGIGMDAGQVPNEAEVRAVASFNDFALDRLTEWWKGEMRRFAPYDIDGGANGRFLIKWSHGGWARKIRTWHHGPKPWERDEPQSLEAILDRCYPGFQQDVWQEWLNWKTARPEVFGKAVAR